MLANPQAMVAVVRQQPPVVTQDLVDVPGSNIEKDSPCLTVEMGTASTAGILL